MIISISSHENLKGSLLIFISLPLSYTAKGKAKKNIGREGLKMAEKKTAMSLNERHNRLLQDLSAQASKLKSEQRPSIQNDDLLSFSAISDFHSSPGFSIYFLFFSINFAPKSKSIAIYLLLDFFPSF